MSPIAPALHPVFVAAANNLQQFPLGSLINRTQRAGWAFLFSDVYTSGAMEKRTLENGVRAVARGVQMGQVEGARNLRDAMSADFARPETLQQGRFSEDTSRVLAKLRKNFYGRNFDRADAIDAAIYRFANKGEEGEPIVRVAQNLMDKILERSCSAYTGDLLVNLRTLLRTERSPLHTLELLDYFGVILRKKGHRWDKIEPLLQLEMTRLESLDQKVLDTLSQAAGATITSEELDRAIKAACRDKRGFSVRKYQLTAVQTFGQDIFIVVQYATSTVETQATQKTGLRVVFNRGSRLNNARTRMVPFVAIKLIPDQMVGSTPGFNEIGHMLPDLAQRDMIDS